jgi:hypothetical protein
MRFFNKQKNKKLPRAAQEGLAPRKEFIERGKERFLAAYDASALAHGAQDGAYSYNRQPARPAYITAFFKVGIGAMAALCIGVGLSAYADTANVPPTNPLYPLKRLSENVQLAVTPTPEKPQLEATFAVRRANEIEDLQTSQPSSTLIPKLTSDLDEDISSSLNMNDDEGKSGRVHAGENFVVSATSTASSTALSTSTDSATIDIYCGAFDVSTSGVFIGRLESNLVLHPRALAEFDRQCGSGKDTNDNATSTSSINNGIGDGGGNHGDRGDGGSGEGDATTTASTTIITGTSSLGGHIIIGGPIPHIGGHD